MALQTQSSQHRKCRGDGVHVTNQPGDVASPLQHFGQGGLVEWKAPHRGDRKVVRDSIAEAKPAGEQGGPGGRAGGRRRVEVHKPARRGEQWGSAWPQKAEPREVQLLGFQRWEKAPGSASRGTGKENEAQRRVM